MEYKTLTSKEIAKDEGTKLVVALGKIIKSRDWKIVLEQHFQQRLQSARSKLEREKDPIELYKAQGAIEELNHLFALEKTHQSLLNTTE